MSDGKAARISAHLSDCPECADVYSGLAGVSQLLASVQVPSMPEMLSQRVQAAIADEAGQRVARTPAPMLAGGDLGRSVAMNPGRPGPARRPRIRAWSSSPLLLRGLAAAGVIVLLVGGGILLANQRGTGPSTSAGARKAAEPARSRPGTAAVGSTALARLRYQQGAETKYTSAMTSRVNYTKADLPAGIRQVVADKAQLTVPRMNINTSAAPSEPSHQLNHTTVGELESCLSTVAAGRTVLLVEVARYLGVPATIIVFDPVSDAFDVIVVGEACGSANPDIITTLAVPTK